MAVVSVHTSIKAPGLAVYCTLVQVTKKAPRIRSKGLYWFCMGKMVSGRSQPPKNENLRGFTGSPRVLIGAIARLVGPAFGVDFTVKNV